MCFRLLKTCSFGFAHQILTSTRTFNESITSRIGRFGFWLLGRLTNLVVHGRDYLRQDEFDRCLRNFEHRYFLYLGRCVVGGRNRDF